MRFSRDANPYLLLNVATAHGCLLEYRAAYLAAKWVADKFACSRANALTALFGSRESGELPPGEALKLLARADALLPHAGEFIGQIEQERALYETIRGVVLFRMGDKAAAKKCWSACRAEGDRMGWSSYFLGRLAFSNGERERAISFAVDALQFERDRHASGGLCHALAKELLRRCQLQITNLGRGQEQESAPQELELV